jgi:hypothetical protein
MHPWELQLLQLTTALRVWLLESISDADLAFALPGNPSIGESLVDLGRTERAYTDSFVTRRLDHAALTVPAPGEPADAGGSVAALQGWFASMDAELEAVVTAIPEDEFRAGRVDRGGGFSMPIFAQFATYREAILIAMAKIDVALRAMGRQRGEQWEDWLG